MSVHDREVECVVCQRWVLLDRVGYLAEDHYESRHAYPLCPRCQALGTLLALWAPSAQLAEVLAMAQAAQQTWQQHTVLPRQLVVQQDIPS